MSVLSWLSGLFATRPPFMSRPGATPGSLVTLHWKVQQVDVYMENDSVAAEEAVLYWNVAIGRRFFAPPIPAIPDILRAFATPTIRANLKGAVLVRVDDTMTDHGDTQEEYDNRTGEIINMIVTLPRTAHNVVDVAKHEFGHCLGLDHGPEGTLMAPRITDGPNPIAGYQLKAVRGI